jgi:hypothetical protein
MCLEYHYDFQLLGLIRTRHLAMLIIQAIKDRHASLARRSRASTRAASNGLLSTTSGYSE